MSKIYKVEEYSRFEKLTLDFLESIDNDIIIENQKSDDNDKLVKKIIKDLKLNFNLVGIFGSGIGAFYPIVTSLLSDMSIEVTQEVAVLSTICATTIIYLEESKIKYFEKRKKLVKDSKTLLEELKLRGVGNGIIKKLITAFHSIKNIFSIISKHLGAVITGFIDMFSYTSILIPVMNAIYFVIDKYDMNLDNILSNFAGLALGITTIAGKHFIIDIINKIKSKFPIKRKKVIDEIETPIIQKFGDKTYGYEEPNKGKSEIIQE